MVLNAVKEPFATYRVVVHLWFMVLNNSCFLSIWYNREEFLGILSAFISVFRYVIQVFQLYFLSISLFSVHTKYLLLVYSIGAVLTLPNCVRSFLTIFKCVCIAWLMFRGVLNGS